MHRVVEILSTDEGLNKFAAAVLGGGVAKVCRHRWIHDPQPSSFGAVRQNLAQGRIYRAPK
eukprot:7130262-Ditylum_brightwellii.AAC.1